MIENPIDILEQFPVRKTKKQKKAFREAAMGYGRRLCYEPYEEKGSFGARNLVFGDPEKAEYLITAHYDTCAAMPIPNFITPCNFLIYLLYQIAIVLGFFLVAFAAGLAVGLLAPQLGSGVAMAVYWLLLLLVMFGPANQHNANDNTSGVVALFEIAKTLPESCRDRVCFVLFDLEEAGLLGSAGFRSRHKNAPENQLVLNMDCVGEGDHLRFFPSKKVRKDGRLMALLERCEMESKTKDLRIVKKGGFYPSDQASFPRGVGICALKRKGRTLYMDRIHTKKDTCLDMTNVNILRAALISCIACEKKG